MKRILIDYIGWGLLLWFIGYVLGIVFFMILPEDLIGLVILPIGVAITLWVLFKKIKSKKLSYYFWLGIVWAVIAIVFDYLFIVKAFNSTNYYKFDVYIYYLLTVLLPLFVGWRKAKS